VKQVTLLALPIRVSKGTVHLIVDMELNKENRHIVMQWNDSTFIAADNGILSMLSQKIVPQRMVAINIRSTVSEATGLDVLLK
jgi:S-adenosylmethionine hydrolase